MAKPQTFEDVAKSYACNTPEELSSLLHMLVTNSMTISAASSCLLDFCETLDKRKEAEEYVDNNVIKKMSELKQQSAKTNEQGEQSGQNT